MNIADIAKVCHEANRALCEVNGDNSQKEWYLASAWQQDSAVDGVVFRLQNPNAPDSAQHDAWMADKVRGGWTYGPEKDPVKMTHPCLVPYDQLPEFQKKKDALFRAIVDALKD